jgi:hypothetical protein
MAGARKIKNMRRQLSVRIVHPLLHILDGRPHRKVMIPNKNPMEELSLA